MLIETEAPEFYKMVTKYISVIKSAEKSGMCAWGDPPAFDVGARTASASLTWYASCIVHDAHHSKLYNDYREISQGNVPADVWTGRKAEDSCITEQLKFLRAIDAPKNLIKHCQKMYNIDYFSDYKNRNW